MHTCMQACLQVHCEERGLFLATPQALQRPGRDALRGFTSSKQTCSSSKHAEAKSFQPVHLCLLPDKQYF
eukprot:504668-Amphidinium_carterae.1